MSLRKTMATGAAWTLIEKVGSQGMSFAVFTIIARLVGPEEYGLVSLCYIYLALAYTLFSSMVDGVVSLRIRDDKRLSTLFWSVVGSGLVLSCACFAVAGPFAEFMEQPRLKPLLQWFSLLPILFAFTSVPTILVTMSMNFRIFTIRTIAATTIGGIVGIVMALKGFGAYAVVGQQIVLYIVINFIIWPGCGWHPRFLFSPKELVDILKPGLKMSGSLFVNLIESQAPRLLIGHFLGPIAVGHFAFVTRMRQALHEVLIYPLSTVSYPAFAHILEDAGEQKKILSELIPLSGTIVFPFVAGAIVTAPIYVPLLFGNLWASAVPVLQIFLITGACLPFLTLMRDFLRAHNCMGTYLKMQVFIAIGSLLVTYLLVPQGLVLMTKGIVVFSLLSLPILIAMVARKTKIRLWHDGVRLWAPLAASVVMAATLYFYDNSAFIPAQRGLHLLIDVVMGCFMYGVASFAFQFREALALIKIIKDRKSLRLLNKEAGVIEDDIGRKL